MFNDGVSPQDSSVVPQDDGATMFNDVVSPQDDGAMMFNDVVSPQDDGATTFNDVVSPQDDGAALFNCGVLPSFDIAAPTMVNEAPQDGMNAGWAASRIISPARAGRWAKRPKAGVSCLNSSADGADPIHVARTRKVWRMRISCNRGATGRSNVTVSITCVLARVVCGVVVISVAWVKSSISGGASNRNGLPRLMSHFRHPWRLKTLRLKRLG